MVTLNKQYNCLKHRNSPPPGQPGCLSPAGSSSDHDLFSDEFLPPVHRLNIFAQAFRPLQPLMIQFLVSQGKDRPSNFLPSISKTTCNLTFSFYFYLFQRGCYQHTQASFCMLWDPFFFPLSLCFVCGILIPRPGIEPESPALEA